MATRNGGSIVAYGPRRFRVRWFDPVKSAQVGRRIYPSAMVHGSKRDAQKLLAEKIRLAGNGIATSPNRETLWEYLDSWLEEQESTGNLRPRTLEGYRSLLDIHVRRQPIGSIRLDRLTERDLARTYGALYSRPRPLSARSIRILHTLINKALRRAVRRGLLLRNPAEDVELPRQQKREMSVLSPEQARAFLQEAKDDSLYALWVVLVTCGLRPSEALGLKWTDVANESLQIRRSLSWTRDAWHLLDTKTTGSRRSIPLDSEALRALAEHRIKQARQKLSLGAAYEDHGLIFASAVGSPLDPKNVKRRHFVPLLKRANLPPIRMYDLRHTMATALLALDTNPKIVAERLGHASIRQTLDTYSHVLPTMQTQVTQRLSALLFAAD